MGKTLVWIDENIAKKLQIIDEVAEIKDKDLKKIIQQLKDDIDTMKECVSEDVIDFRYYAQQVRDSYKKVVEEELQKTYELWEQLSKLRIETKNKLGLIQDLTQSIAKDIELIQKNLLKFNIYGLDQLLQVLTKFKDIPDEDKELLYKLFEIKKRNIKGEQY